MHPKGNLYLVALVLVLVGALNWGLIALNGTNLVTAATSAIITDMETNAMIVRVVYALVGLAALFVIYKEWPKN
jgi:uncharacterized membrane protein YuzA (DUF378 family)